MMISGSLTDMVRIARQGLRLLVVLCCVLTADSAGVLAESDSSAFLHMASRDITLSDQLANDANKAYRNASYLQALRLSRDVLARYPEHHMAMLILLKSMAQLGMVGQTAEAAISYAGRYHAGSAQVNEAISQLYLAQGNQRKAAYYHSLSRRQYCAFNCQ
jgi:hypothetical protein